MKGRSKMGWSRTGGRYILVGVAMTLLVIGALVIGTVAAGRSRARTATTHTIKVAAIHQWTDTGITVRKGVTVTISARGTIKYGSGSGHKASPVGRKFNQERCGEAAYYWLIFGPFVAPGVNCWAMLFRIGGSSGVAFPTGKKITFVAPVTGKLELGVNDDHFGDNSGAWTASVVTP